MTCACIFVRLGEKQDRSISVFCGVGLLQNFFVKTATWKSFLSYIKVELFYNFAESTELLATNVIYSALICNRFLYLTQTDRVPLIC